jgi:hypothetical protein
LPRRAFSQCSAIVGLVGHTNPLLHQEQRSYAGRTRLLLRQ